MHVRRCAPVTCDGSVAILTVWRILMSAHRKMSLSPRRDRSNWLQTLSGTCELERLTLCTSNWSGNYLWRKREHKLIVTDKYSIWNQAQNPPPLKKGVPRIRKRTFWSIYSIISLIIVLITTFSFCCSSFILTLSVKISRGTRAIAFCKKR